MAIFLILVNIYFYYVCIVLSKSWNKFITSWFIKWKQFKWDTIKWLRESRVLTLDGNSEIGAHERINLCYLTCIRLLISSRAVTHRIFFYFPSCLRNMFALLSYISTMLRGPVEISKVKDFKYYYILRC